MKRAIASSLLLLTGAMAHAADVKLSWQLPAPQTGVTILRSNIYRATTAGAENMAGPQTDQVIGLGTTVTELNVAPGTYFYKATVVATMPDGTTKESAFSNEVSAVVPPAVIILGVPVLSPVQIITH